MALSLLIFQIDRDHLAVGQMQKSCTVSTNTGDACQFGLYHPIAPVPLKEFQAKGQANAGVKAIFTHARSSKKLLVTIFARLQFHKIYSLWSLLSSCSTLFRNLYDIPRYIY